MVKLIENELIKILKRKNIYILLIVTVIAILSYNLFQKVTNPNVEVKEQYKKGYELDKVYLETHENIENSKYEQIIERIELEKYAIKNNIEYNILLNTENTSAQLPTDARITLMKLFDNFGIIIASIIVYISSTIISEEYNNGTIKNLLIKPHKRSSILLAKIIVNIFVLFAIMAFTILIQYILGGALFGFESYDLDAIIYNQATQEINVMNFANYLTSTFLHKIIIYVLLLSTSLLISVITNNIAMNILSSFGIYMILDYVNITNSVEIPIITLVVIYILLAQIFKRKDVKNQ